MSSEASTSGSPLVSEHSTMEDGTATVTLPREEVLRLTTLHDDETYIDVDANVDAHVDTNGDDSRRESEIDISQSRTRSNGKSPRSKRKKKEQHEQQQRVKPARTKSGGSSGSRKLKKAVKNEKKSVDKVVAAAIRKYEESPSSPHNHKTRTTPRRTKSGSSGKKDKSTSDGKTSSVVAGTKKKGRKKKNGIIDDSQEQQETSNNNEVSSAVPSIDHLAGAIAVFPSDSGHATTRRSTNVDDNLFANDEESQNDPNSDSAYEEIPEPPQSQVIHAIATYEPGPPLMQRNISEAHTHSSSAASTTSGSRTSGTVPSLATGLDTESGTVTATAVSSEGYYAEVRRQLREEAVAAVAVVPLSEDGSPMKNNTSPNGSANTHDYGVDRARKKAFGRKNIWICCAILAVVVLIGISAAVAARSRSRNAKRNQPKEVESLGNLPLPGTWDMDAVMSVMNSEEGAYWRQGITRILPRDTLITILETPDYSSPQYKAFYFLVSNSEQLFGSKIKDIMNVETDLDLTPEDVSRISTLFGLVTLYESTGGSNWSVKSGWLQPEIDFCEWHGVNCDGDEIQKTSFEGADQNNLSILPPPPGDLEDKGGQYDETSYNYPDVENWKTVYYSLSTEDRENADGYFDNKVLIHSLDLKNNNLSGSIPMEISCLSSIYSGIHLSRNKLSGTIPPDIAMLSNMQALNLGRNKLEGELPIELAKMVELRVFDIAGNQKISGDFNKRFASWNNIVFLDLHNTQITGTIPEEFCDMVETRRETGDPPFEFKPFKDFVFKSSCPDRIDCPCCTLCCDSSQMCSPTL